MDFYDDFQTRSLMLLQNHLPFHEEQRDSLMLLQNHLPYHEEQRDCASRDSFLRFQLAFHDEHKAKSWLRLDHNPNEEEDCCKLQDETALVAGGGGGGGQGEVEDYFRLDHHPEDFYKLQDELQLKSWPLLDHNPIEEEDCYIVQDEAALDGGRGGGGGEDYYGLVHHPEDCYKLQYETALDGGAGDGAGEEEDYYRLQEKTDVDGAGGGDGEEEDGQQEEEGEEEESETASPFIEYRPSRLSCGCPHPDPVVETTSLSAVQLPEPTYELAIAQDMEQSRALSCLQLETLVYASQRHLQLLPDGSRAAFFLGDGAGVGKGRTVAGLIWENWQQGRRKALWLSIGSDLLFDARRDLNDVGASCVPLHALNKLSYSKLDSQGAGVKEGVLFLTYNSLIAKSAAAGRTRFQQVVEWCGGGEDFDGLLIFDECHKAKNLVADGSKKASTQTGRAVRDLQNALSLARVVYCSATGASEPRNMAYMVRLGLWGPGTHFSDFEAFLGGLEKGGVGALEVLAMEMKARGMYLCRTLSFKGAEFQTVEVDLEPETKEKYAKAAQFWEKLRSELGNALKELGIHSIDRSEQAKKDDGKEKKRKPAAGSSLWRYYWGSHQRFFRSVCMAAKVPTLVNLVNQALKDGKCAVIGLQSTGEACTEEVVRKQGGGASVELDDFVSGPKELLLKLVERHFPVPGEKIGKAQKNGRSPSSKKKRKAVGVPVEQGKKKRGKNSCDTIVIPCLDNPIGCSVGRIAGEEEDMDIDLGGGGDDSSGISSNNTEVGASWDSSNNTGAGAGASPNSPNNTVEDGDCDLEATQDGDYKETASPEAFIQGSAAQRQRFLEKREQLLADIRALDLPKNPLDDLIDQLGGPKLVAEMTGRKGMLVRSGGADKKMVVYQSRSDQEDVSVDMVNMHEKKQFMEGKKLIAIISEAASVGVSLQADKRAANQRRRVHITLELPWSADKAIQQFGRTHRSNQTSAPEYKLLFTNLGGERRFASVVAKRLESLGALTQGDRRAGPSLSTYNYDSVHGRKALAKMYDQIMGKTNQELPILRREEVLPPSCCPADAAQFYECARDALRSVGIVRNDTSSNNKRRRCNEEKEGITDADRHDVGRFLNRLLGLDPVTQNSLFGWFLKIMDKIVKIARMTGDFDAGTKNIKGASIKLTEDPKTVFVDAQSGAQTKLHVVDVDQGLSWEAAKQLLEGSYAEGQLTLEYNGFYEASGPQTKQHSIMLAIERPGSFPRRFKIFHPHNGAGDTLRLLPLDTLQASFQKLGKTELEAKEAWTRSFEHKTLVVQKQILCGFILPLWGAVEKALQQERLMKDRILRVVRAETTSAGNKQQRIVGVELPPDAASRLLKLLTNFRFSWN